MKAMLLAAGRGERMRPLTDRTPKPLLEVGGKPLIVWLIERLRSGGFTELVINRAHLGEQLEARLGDGRALGVHIAWSPEAVALETAGGIAQALPLLGAAPFVAVNADVWTDFDFATLHARAARLEDAHLVLVDNPAHHPTGDFALEPPFVRNRGTPMLTFSGIGVYSPQLFADVTRGTAAKLAPLLRRSADDGRLRGEHFNGWWEDIGTPERLDGLDLRLRHAVSERNRP